MSSREIALVTGASKGIGEAIAKALAADGYDIWLNYRSDHDGAKRIASEIEELGVSCTLMAFDVSDIKGTGKFLEPYLEENTPYILVNNAGITRDTLLLWMAEDDWRDVMKVHLDGFYAVTKALIQGMVGAKKGRIINIVSTSGETGVAGQVNYSADKAGLIGATKSLAAEVAKRNILVNAVAPGFIETEMIKDLPLDKIKPMIPMKRIGKPKEVADVVSFLCSDKATYITGQVISVNGGAYM
jgi:3-oxoacyl-[acyl-carrier protein] reductase